MHLASYRHAATNEHAYVQNMVHACRKQQPLSYIGLQQLVYTGDITSYMSNQTKYLIA